MHILNPWRMHEGYGSPSVRVYICYTTLAATYLARLQVQSAVLQGLVHSLPVAGIEAGQWGGLDLLRELGVRLCAFARVRILATSHFYTNFTAKITANDINFRKLNNRFFFARHQIKSKRPVQ